MFEGPPERGFEGLSGRMSLKDLLQRVLEGLPERGFEGLSGKILLKSLLQRVLEGLPKRGSEGLSGRMSPKGLLYKGCWKAFQEGHFKASQEGCCRKAGCYGGWSKDFLQRLSEACHEE